MSLRSCWVVRSCRPLRQPLPSEQPDSGSGFQRDSALLCAELQAEDPLVLGPHRIQPHALQERHAIGRGPVFTAKNLAPRRPPARRPDTNRNRRWHLLRPEDHEPRAPGARDRREAFVHRPRRFRYFREREAAARKQERAEDEELRLRQVTQTDTRQARDDDVARVALEAIRWPPRPTRGSVTEKTRRRCRCRRRSGALGWTPAEAGRACARVPTAGCPAGCARGPGSRTPDDRPCPSAARTSTPCPHSSRDVATTV